jgi:hypothetical protein
MAKREVKWSLLGSVLSMSKYLNETSDVILQVTFDLIEIFPEFNTLTDVQKYVVQYGVKQRLSDKGANDIANIEGKVASAKTIWADLVAGKLQHERSNASTAKVQLAQANSMVDLLMKKLNGETLTDEQEAFLTSAKERIEAGKTAK